MRPMRWSGVWFLCVMLAYLAGCTPEGRRDASRLATDRAYLEAAIWDDGQAEIAFYRVERTVNQYGDEDDQSFDVGTYLVKHDFDPTTMSKATEDAVPAFKYALFYEIESGSYQYKRNYVVNAARADLRPLKQSFSSFDWCSNLYREMAFDPADAVVALQRSDDYGNYERRFAYEGGTVPVEELPLLVRALDFTETSTQELSVVLPEGRVVPARATRVGTEEIAVAGETRTAERIDLHYDEPVPSLVAETSDATERYFRGADPARLLLKVEGASGRYRMTLMEALRAPYWEEDIWSRLNRVSARP